MAVLHLISQPSGLAPCLEIARATDKLLLLGDAAPLGLEGHERPLHVLADDLPAEHHAEVADDTELVDYATFVDLVVECQPVVSWR